MRFRIFFLIVVMLFISVLSFAQDDAKELFYKGNLYYENGEYAEAIKTYEEVLNKGYESGNLYYNLANSYFKSDDLGKAILYFERAMRLIPRDGDLESNYKYALSLTKNNLPEQTRFFVARFIQSTAAHFTINELLIAMSSIFFIFIITVLSHLYFGIIRKNFRNLIIILVVIFITGAVIFLDKFNETKNRAVVVFEKASSKFEPSIKATTYFTLYEGANIKVLTTRGDWCKIKRPDGKIGWVEKSNIEMI